MDKETKDFFEKLSGINNGEEEKTITDNEEMPEIFEETEGELSVDVYQNSVAFIIESTIAGVNPDDIDVNITRESITIRGKREKEERVKIDNYIHQECYWGRFSRTIILPQEIDPDKAQASIKNGVLKVILPKVNKSKAKKIKVKFE